MSAFTTLEELNEHIIQHHEGVKCPERGEFGSRPGELPDSTMCDQCGTNMNTPKLLLRHIQLHHKKQFECVKCQKYFGTANALRVSTHVHIVISVRNAHELTNNVVITLPVTSVCLIRYIYCKQGFSS